MARSVPPRRRDESKPRRARARRPGVEGLEPIRLLTGLPAVANVVKIHDGAGNPVYVGFSAAKSPVFLVDDFANGNVYSVLYDAKGAMTGYAWALPDGKGGASYLDYTPQGQLTRVEVNDASGQDVTVSWKDGAIYEYTTSYYDSSGNFVTNRYDASGQVTFIEVDSPAGSTSSASLSNGSVTGITKTYTDAYGDKVYQQFNGSMGLVFARVTTPSGAVGLATYDGYGHVTGSGTATTDSSGNRVVTAYDKWGYKSGFAEFFANGTVLSASYTVGLLDSFSITRFDEAGNAISDGYNGSGTKTGITIASTDAKGDLLVYKYNAQGQSTGFVEYFVDGSVSTKPPGSSSAVRPAYSPGVYLNALLGPTLATILGPMLFPMNYGIDVFNLDSLTRANYNALSTFYSYIPKSDLGYNYGAAMGAIDARAQFSAAASNLFAAEDRKFGDRGLL